MIIVFLISTVDYNDGSTRVLVSFRELYGARYEYLSYVFSYERIITTLSQPFTNECETTPKARRGSVSSRIRSTSTRSRSRTVW